MIYDTASFWLIAIRLFYLSHFTPDVETFSYFEVYRIKALLNGHRRKGNNFGI
jgi:hypothetical protein